MCSAFEPDGGAPDPHSLAGLVTLLDLVDNLYGSGIKCGLTIERMGGSRNGGGRDDM
jgi:hypothetical protein